MITLNKKEDCCGCSACDQICPVCAICMVEDEEGFLYPAVDKDICIKCNRCEMVCPNKISDSSIWRDDKVYAAYRNNREARMKSASGGVFAAIAEEILRQQGIVYGAAYQEDFSVAHVRIETFEELNYLLGSKYVQSELGNTFQLIKRDIETNRKVLFCGTPCQVAGLKHYLESDNENLILIDFVCHGVPSPKVWKQYLNEIAHGRKISRLIPRDKTGGIRNCPIKIYFENGTAFTQKYESNEYLRGFAANLFLRPSCYQCKHKGIKHCSDLTLADFWGIEKEKPGFGDEYGISAIFIRSPKGKWIIQKVQNELTMEESVLDQFVPYNPSAVVSVAEQPLRAQFFELAKTKGVCSSVSFLLGNEKTLRAQKKLKELKYVLSVCGKKVKLLMERKIK